ncbi:hypothetical protein FRB91_008582 [Serendipita sp. 411]|nr:hypothetical protein FRC18_003318 [Serendipita sp. 400]KAG8850999.1 hypothetical protein FRB91_008582 [Serendipita sp. 411]
MFNVLDQTIPPSTRQPAALAYPAYHCCLKEDLNLQYKDKMVAKNELQLYSAIARTAAHQGVSSLTLIKQKALFALIEHSTTSNYSLDHL